MKTPEFDAAQAQSGDELASNAGHPMQPAYDRIVAGKTPPPMENPYTGLPMNRAERRRMKHKVQKRVKQLKKGKKK